MTDQERHDDMKPPGRPLWLAAERKRVSEGWTKLELVKQIGIGRVTFDRLYSQPTPPLARTVKKIADVLGLDYDYAMRLAGLDREAGQLPALGASMQGRIGQPADDRIMSSIPEEPMAGNLPAADAEQAKRALRRLRDLADKNGMMLVELLDEMGVIDPEILTHRRRAQDEVVEEIKNDDLPDDLKEQFLDGYRRLREQVAADARRRSGS